MYTIMNAFVRKDGPKIDIPENVDDDDALDMFGGNKFTLKTLILYQICCGFV